VSALATPRGESSAPTGRISAEALRLTRIRVDGGAAENNLLMQFQSDVSDLCIERPLELESTARGAAMLAGVGADIFESVSQAARMVSHPERFVPQMTLPLREQHMSTWRAALDRARSVVPASDAAEQGRVPRP
jgi:glycerol kinase